MKKLIVYSVTVLIAIFALDFVIGSLLDRMFSSRSFAPAAEAFDNQYDLALLGPSEMNNQYIPAILSDSLGISVYNYGYGGQNIYYQYALLNVMINRAPKKPQWVIWEPQAIDFYDMSGYNTERLNVLNPMYALDDSLKSIVDLQGWRTSILLKTLKCYKHNSKILSYFKDLVSPMVYESESGYIAIEPVEFSDSLETIRGGEGHVIDILKIDYLHRMILLCKNNDIKLIVMNAPYYELHENIVWTQKLEEILNEEEIPFINYDNDPYFISHREWYYNRVHFNKYGAEEYSKYIIKNLRKYLRQ